MGVRTKSQIKASLMYIFLSKLSTRPPIPASRQPDECRPHRQADHGRIQKDGDTQRESQNFNQHKVAKNKSTENHNHDGGGKTDDAARTGEALHQRLAVGKSRSPALRNPSHDEHLIVHAQAEYDAEYKNGQYRKTAVHWAIKAHNPRPNPTLKNQGNGAECRGN